MDHLKNNNGLQNRNPIIQKRNVTLGANNNVLKPNRLKIQNNISHKMFNDYRKDKANNMQPKNNFNSKFYK